MSTTAADLRELHTLHQRAKALRDSLASGPKTLAARQAVLASRKAAVEQARKELLEGKAVVKRKEVQLQGQQAKSEELRIKLNQVRKQDEYNAIVSQLNLDSKTMNRLEDEILEGMTRSDEHTSALEATEADVAKLAREVDALRQDIESKAGGQRTQLGSLETAIAEAEAIIPADQRDQYRRIIKQHGADALAAAEGGACTGCYVSVTAQMMNELINAQHLVFCKICGRVLYLPEEDHPNTRRSAR
jgi:predicted  nucleic acid-binding Zn-ribbon protein